jgi:hypothetical protein
VLLTLYAAWAYRRTLPPLALPRRVLLAALRITGFILLILFALDPSIVSRSESSRQPVVALLVDISGSMSIEENVAERRIDSAVAAAEVIAGSLGGARVDLLPFAADLHSRPVSSDSIPDADGEGTDIYGAVAGVERRYAGDNLAAVVLISDGRITRGMSGRNLPGRVPIFAVAVGDTLEGADLAVDRVEYERNVYTGTREKIRAVIRYSSVAGQALSIELLEEGRILDTFRTEILAGSGLVEADLGFVPSERGLRTMEVRVVPLEGEVTEGNNRESFRINVLSDRIEILFFEGSPDWNMTFIRRLCRGSKRLHLDAVIPGRGGGYRMAGGAGWEFPAGADILSGYDLVIVGGTAAFPSVQEAETLSRYIESGGAVLFIASESSLLLSGRALALLAPSLPVVPSGTPRIETSELVVERGPARGAPYLPDLDVGVLPPLSGAIEGLSPTSGAHVHLVMTGNGPEKPFLVVQRVERGMSAVLLGFPVWRWKLAGEDGAAAYDGLMGGLLQFLAEGRKAPPLDVQTDRTAYRMGESPRITIFPSTGRMAGNMRGELVTPGSGGIPVETFIPMPDSDRPGVFTADLEHLPPGEYAVRVKAGADGAFTVEGTASFVVEPLSVELLRTSVDAGLLGRIAAASGGTVVHPDEAGKLAGLIDLEEDTVVSKSVRKIRGKIWFFVVIVLVFAAEWLLRKFLGLV